MAEQIGESMPQTDGGRKFPVEEFSRFHQELKEIRASLAASLDKKSELLQLTGDVARERISSGKPVLELPVALPEEGALCDAAIRILDTVVKNEVFDKPEADAAKKIIEGGGLDIVALTSVVVTGDSYAVEKAALDSGLALDTLLFLVEQLARATLTWHSAGIKGLFDDEVKTSRTGACPVCGSHPRVSIIEGEEGVRKLACGMCETVWRYKRIGCPFCGSEDQKKFRRFTVDDEPGLSALLCNVCKRYLKQIDRRKLGDDEYGVTELETMSSRFDILARREGYR